MPNRENLASAYENCVWCGVTHRLKGLKHLRAVEKLATWRYHGFDQYDVFDGQWFHSPLPLTPEETTESMWTYINALKEEISLSEKERSEQRVESFLNEFEGGPASFTNEKSARLKHIVERRGRAAAHAIVALIGTAQPSDPRSRCSGISFDVSVCTEERIEGKMEPELGEIESASGDTGPEAPGK